MKNITAVMVMATLLTATASASASDENSCYMVYEKYTHPYTTVASTDKRIISSSSVECAKGAHKAWEEIRRTSSDFEYYDRFLMSNLSRLLNIARGK